jgi:hypothetical protein
MTWHGRFRESVYETNHLPSIVTAVVILSLSPLSPSPSPSPLSVSPTCGVCFLLFFATFPKLEFFAAESTTMDEYENDDGLAGLIDAAFYDNNKQAPEDLLSQLEFDRFLRQHASPTTSNPPEHEKHVRPETPQLPLAPRAPRALVSLTVSPVSKTTGFLFSAAVPVAIPFASQFAAASSACVQANLHPTVANMNHCVHALKVVEDIVKKRIKELRPDVHVQTAGGGGVSFFFTPAPARPTTLHAFLKGHGQVWTSFSGLHCGLRFVQVEMDRWRCD